MIKIQTLSYYICWLRKHLVWFTYRISNGYEVASSYLLAMTGFCYGTWFTATCL